MNAVKKVLSVISAAAMIPLAGIAAGNAEASCPDTQYFAVGGVSDGASQYVPGIPQGASVTRIHYSGSLAPVGNTAGDVSVREGERKLDGAVRAFRDQCPNSQTVVVGNSMGALIAGNVRDKWNGDPSMHKNMKVVLVADPRAKTGAMSMLPTFIPGFTHTGPRPDSVIPTSNVCRSNDFICNVGNPLTNPGHAVNAAIGYLTGAHDYSGVVDSAPGNHVPADTKRYVPETPIPLPIPAPSVLEPIARAIVPSAPITTEYVPTPVREYLPPIIKDALPPNVLNGVLPPLPRIPGL